ncbi:MAG: cytochrome c biogenesis protein CcsA, partial [Bosea sp. (in: a-proteobacteria)]
MTAMDRLLTYANPQRFMRFSSAVLPWMWAACALAFSIGLWGAFAKAPADYQQGETIRIMFIHVPSAWLALFLYSMMSLSALGTLVWRHPLADVAQKAAAPIGAVFTLVCLLTGAFWGKPMWGTYWVWDARLTSVLVLFLIYLGIIALWRSLDDHS